MSDKFVVKWGIISCGHISHDFTLSLFRLNSPRHQLVGAASRNSLEAAQKFAKAFNMPKAFATYAELLADPDINAVYIGNIHPAHLESCLAAIEAGKAVLCEKPLTMSEADSKKIMEAARVKGVLVVEAVWSRFSPVYARIRELLNGPSGLKPASLMVNFTCNLMGVERMVQPELGGGSMWDIGIYPLQFAQMVFGEKPPIEVTASGEVTSQGVDLAESVTLRYEGGGLACLLSDARCGTVAVCEARIFFKTGGQFASALVPGPFWSPTKLILTKQDGTQVEENYPIFPNANTNDGMKHNFPNSQGLAYEAEGFADAFEKWQRSRQSPDNIVIESELISHSTTLLMARIMDEVILTVRSKANKSN